MAKPRPTLSKHSGESEYTGKGLIGRSLSLFSIKQFSQDTSRCCNLGTLWITSLPTSLEWTKNSDQVITEFWIGPLFKKKQGILKVSVQLSSGNNQLLLLPVIAE